MKDIVPYISPLIESQFPAFYREEGPQFIALVKAYYEWMEQANNVLYHTRRLLEYRDIDQTVEDFIVYFKEETLKNIQFDTATNKRLLAKNALDLYRSKGTARSIDLFFKLVYAQPAKVYYPGDDLFKLSDNKWKIPEYLEITYNDFNYTFEGKQIRGLSSGATAFVENYVIKKKINKQYDLEGNEVSISKSIYIFYISNIRGDFDYNETIIHNDIVDTKNCPKIIGSLSQVQVIAGASDYIVGDVVSLTSNTGYNGKALVTSISNVTGQVEFTLIDGGWGFTLNPKIIMSEKALEISNVSPSIGSLNRPFKLFSSLVQPKALIDFELLTGPSLQVNDLLYSYNANNIITSISKVINISSGNSGNSYLSVISGNLPEANGKLYSVGNISSINVESKDDRTSFANIMGSSFKNVLTINDIKGNLPSIGDIVYQTNSSHGTWVTATIDLVKQESGLTRIYVSNTNGSFVSSQRLFYNSGNSYISTYSTYIGIYNTSETSISTIDIVANGANYTNGEILSITSNSGSKAYAMIRTNSSGNVSSINLIDGGTGYLTPPLITISDTENSYSFNANSSVNEDLDFITLSSHTFYNTQLITYQVSTGNTALIGLSPGSGYYVRKSNSSGIQISTAPSGPIISLTKGKTESGHSFASVATIGNGFIANAQLGYPYDYNNELFIYSTVSDPIYFNSYECITSTNHIITFKNTTRNIFANNQAIVYRVDGEDTSLDLLSNNMVYYVREPTEFSFKLADADGNIIQIEPQDPPGGNLHSFRAFTSGNIKLTGEGSLAEVRVNSLDDEETIELYEDIISGRNIYGAPYLNIIIDASGNSALSGTNSYGFPGQPLANLYTQSISDILTKDLYTIGTISLLGTVNPGDDYTLDPFVTMVEPTVVAYNKHDVIMTILGDTTRYSNGEVLYITGRKVFNSKDNVSGATIIIENHPFYNNQQITYITDGSIEIGGLGNNTKYYIVNVNQNDFGLSLEQNGTAIQLSPTSEIYFQYIQPSTSAKFGMIDKIINTSTIHVKRLSMYNDPNPLFSEIYIKGESSNYITRVIDIKLGDTVSGLNSIIEADVIKANGVVKTLKIIDSGFAFKNNDFMSFQRENDKEATVGLVKGSNIKQGFGSGFYQSTKGFLSADKYLHDNDFYQDFSYQIISRVPFDRYSNMLKKVLHVAGTKMFPAIEIESVNKASTNLSKQLEKRILFNPYTKVDTDQNFITSYEVYANSVIKPHGFIDGMLVTYSAPEANGTVISGLINNETYAIAYANTIGFKLKEGNKYTFNANSDVKSNNFITLIDHTLTNAEKIKYEVSVGNTALIGLISGYNYYVAYANSSGIQVSSSPSGSIISITKGKTESGHSFKSNNLTTLVNFSGPLPNENNHEIYSTI